MTAFGRRRWYVAAVVLLAAPVLRVDGFSLASGSSSRDVSCLATPAAPRKPKKSTAKKKLVRGLERAQVEYQDALDVVKKREENARRKKDRRIVARGGTVRRETSDNSTAPQPREQPREEPRTKPPALKQRVVVASSKRKKPLRIAVTELGPAKLVGSFDDVDLLPDLGLGEIAFIGRSNVGKSSMLNSLVGSKKSIAVVSKRPGRTRRINLFEVRDRKGAGCILSDLPGYGYAKLSRGEQDDIGKFVSAYLDRREALRLIVLIVDSRREMDDPALAADFEILDVLRSEKRRTVVVATKMDKLASAELLAKKLGDLSERLRINPQELLYYSAVTDQGRSELWKAISDSLQADDIDAPIVLDSLEDRQGSSIDDKYFQADFDDDVSNPQEEDDEDEIITF